MNARERLWFNGVAYGLIAGGIGAEIIHHALPHWSPGLAASLGVIYLLGRHIADRRAG